MNRKDEQYMELCSSISKIFSTCTKRKYAAILVDEYGHIVGVGYNGFPKGCSDDDLPWAREAEDPFDTKYPYVCHAEQNAILNKNSAEVKGCTIYTAMFPCNECTKMII